MSARILVVDDILANRRLMKAKLEAKYYTVTLAANGPEALRMAVEDAPQIILLDVMMPGMDGYEVCERLKQDERTRHIPVVMLTALSDAENRIRGLNAGADDFLSKPVDDFALMARLEALARYNMVAQELRTREATSQQAAAFTDEEQRELSRPARILVIDSTERATEQITVPLTSRGHKVVTWQESERAGGGGIGGVDIIILALSNQSHDPLKLCAHLRAMDSQREFSIIVTYDPYDGEKAGQALSLGAGDVIVTPLNPQELQARVSTQLRRARFLKIMRQRVDRGLELAVIDQLTGLYNRRYMLGQLDQWMMRSASGGKPISVVSFDVDHFKRVNDEYGHEAGDYVLKHLAERIRSNVRPIDIVCRPGGEEFLVIMPETAGDRACIGAERIRAAIAAEAFRLERSDLELDITISAGVATILPQSDTVEDILHRADKALYKAKQLGRNRTENLAA